MCDFLMTIMPNITFAVDATALANAKAYAAERSTTLNKLINAYLQSLGGAQPRRAVSKAEAILLDYSLGRISLMDATDNLGVPDAGHVFALLRQSGPPFPQLPEAIVRQQVDEHWEFFAEHKRVKPSRVSVKKRRR